LYLRTMRYLKPVQLYGRVWHRFHRPRPDLREPPPPRQLIARPVAGADRTPSMLGPDTVCFLNLEGRIEGAAGWSDPNRSLLWRYNLHYFDDLNARNASQRAAWHQRLIDRWIVENPPGQGIGWDSYPISLRMVNWVKWIASRSDAPTATVLKSLAVQARYLRRRVEHHLQGNHLWVNGKALAFAGILFGGPEGDSWLRDGLRIIDAELDEEILSDGGHFERSPMYHAIILEDVLDLIAYLRLAGHTAMERRLSETASAMMHWLRVMTHPDGQIAQLNDSAIGIAPPVAALADYAARVGLDARATSLRDIEPLPASGYVRLSNDRAVVICDVAPLGPDYQLAHAHADTLTFEMSLDGKRLIVDGGTSTYDSGDRRHRERGTAAHNTVMVNEADSSEIWSSFRVGRRARVSGIRWGRDDDELWLAASHDGYTHLAPSTRHSRQWVLSPRALVITDVLDRAPRSARAFLHLHSSRIARRDAEAVAVDDGRVLITADPSNVGVTPGEVGVEFGKTIPNEVIAIPFDDRLATTIAWQ
jgi:uncharacterized heparinase superfamily protein